MEVLTLFKRITDADLPFLLMEKSASRISCPHVITMFVRTGVPTKLGRNTFLSTAVPTRLVRTAF